MRETEGWPSLDQPLNQNESELHFSVGKDLVYDLASHPEGRLVAIAAADGTIQTNSTREFPKGIWTTRHRHTATARAVAFSPDGRWLASAGHDGVVILSEVSGSAEPRALVDHTSGVECLAFSPDSKRIDSGSKDSKVRAS